MTNPITVFGYGAVGRPIVESLTARGDIVRVATRHRPETLPASVEHIQCDVLDPAQVHRALEGASQAVLAIGFTYDSRIWRSAWPRAMTTMIEACATASTRLVFIDNLYQLGPQTSPLTEDMPLTTQGEKPAIRADITRIWQSARNRVKVAALRSPDFYGPGVTLSHLGASALGNLAHGKTAQFFVPLDIPHDFAYVPDIARAAILLLDAPDTDFGQVWNMPCAPTQTPRTLMAMAAAALNTRLRIQTLPLPLLRLLGLVYRMAREVVDIGFTWDRLYLVDATKFTRHFNFTPTPFETGIPATVRAFAGLTR